MEKEILIKIAEWNSTETSIEVPELSFFKTFEHRVDAEKWANSIFKKVKFENVIHS